MGRGPKGRGRVALLRLGAGLILAAGMALALYVYLSPPTAPEPAGYVLEGGEAAPQSAWDSRAYLRGLEFYGGKSAILMTEIREWFGGLWGASLAVGIVLAALAGAWACLRAADVISARERGRG